MTTSIANALNKALAPNGNMELVTQRKLSREHYQSEAGTATIEAMNLSTDIAPLLSNPMETLDQLANLAPASEYFASNAILGSLGYTVCNSLLWTFRRANAKPKPEEPTVDIFNGSYASMFEKRADREMSEDNGHAALPEFDSLALTGVYMQMLYMQRGNPDYSGKYPAKMPHEIIHEMQVQDRDREIAAAYGVVEQLQLDASPAARAIKAARTRAAVAIDEHKARVHKVELDYVLTCLQRTMPERLTDEAWSAIPLYIQYKWSVAVYKQTVKAVAQELEAKKRDSDRLDCLYDIVNALHLELEAAARTAEVRTAFDQGRLDERHDIMIKEVAEPAQVDTTPARSRFAKAPAPLH